MPTPKLPAREARADPLSRLFAPLRPTMVEYAALKAHEADPAAFAQAQAALDRKYKPGLAGPQDRLGISPQSWKPGTFQEVPGGFGGLPTLRSRSGASVLAELFKDKVVRCDCVVPFGFTALHVYGRMPGADQFDVTEGVIGAARRNPQDYVINNLGETQGKTRVQLGGAMHIVFQCQVPRADRWCLIHPSGHLFLRGHSRVVGHGNFSTSLDAKVTVSYFQVLELGPQILEIAGGEVFSDQTKSEDRHKDFAKDVELPPRAVYFQTASGNETLMLTLRVEVHTEANEDGIASGAVDLFGLPAVSKADYDTLIVPAA